MPGKAGKDASAPQPKAVKLLAAKDLDPTGSGFGKAFLAANEEECLDKAVPGMDAVLERRCQLWACHVCEKMMDKPKSSKSSKEKQKALCNGLSPCELCGAAWYCSEERRRRDWLVHMLLCTKYRPFERVAVVASHKPSESKAIGIELPVDGTVPRLIWIKYGTGIGNRPQQQVGKLTRTTFVSYQDPFYDISARLGGLPQYIRVRGPFWSTWFYVARRQNSALQPVNQCVARMLRKLGPLAFESLKGLFDTDKHMKDNKVFWRGPIVLFRRLETFIGMKPVTLEEPRGGREHRVVEAQQMENMTLADLSWALEYMAWRQVEAVEHPQTADLVPEEWSRWIRSMSNGED